MKQLWTTAISLFIATLCSGNTPVQRTHKDGDLKLVDGPTPNSGTVLVYRGYGWGKICDDNWTIKEANVVCKQLNMGHALEYFRRNHFHTIISSDYLMDEVRCTGNEERLVDCTFGGWATHDCQKNEEVGVKCQYSSQMKAKPKWNLLGVDANKERLNEMSKVEIKLMHPPQLSSLDSNQSIPVIVQLAHGAVGGVCLDFFHSAEAIVFCKQLGQGIGGKAVKITHKAAGLAENTTLAIIGRCYGNETELTQCLTYADPAGVPCPSKETVAVHCLQNLPDITPESYTMESSSYLQKMNLWLLECALEENCLPEQVYRIIDSNPTNYAWITRSLLRFSSYIENVGTAPFRPLEHPDNWEWHACHMHYHSMKVFSRYEVVDMKDQIVAVGHKASFCLEDNICKSGIPPEFVCSTVVDSKGTQGISPGCKDTYLHDYDCQWVDITDILPGRYIFQVSFNPDFYVPESNFFNNALSCELTHLGYNAVIRRCRLIHPNDMY